MASDLNEVLALVHRHTEGYGVAMQYYLTRPEQYPDLIECVDREWRWRRDEIVAALSDGQVSDAPVPSAPNSLESRASEGDGPPGWLFCRWLCKPLDEDGGPEAQTLFMRRLVLVRTPWFSVGLNNILRREGSLYEHDHAADYVSIILRGGYDEVVDRGTHRKLDRHRPGGLIVRRAETRHYIAAVRSPCWTLMFGGRCRHAWSFVHRAEARPAGQR